MREQARRSEHMWHEHRASLMTMLFVMHGLALALTFIHLIRGQIPKTEVLFVYALLVVLGIVGVWILARFASNFLERKREVYTVTLSIVFLSCAVVVSLPMDFSFKNGIVLLLLAAASMPLSFPNALKREGPFTLSNRMPVSAFITNSAILLSIFLLLLFSSEDWFSPLRTPWAIAIFAILFAYLIIRVPNSLRRFLSAFVTAAIFFMIFSLESRITDIADVHHVSYFLGPVVEYLYGGKHPFVNLYSQYGGGMTVVLSQYFRFVGFTGPEAFLVLLKFLTALELIAIYVIATSLYQSRRIALLAVALIFCFHIAAVGRPYFSLPSIGVLRFGWIYVVLLLITLAHRSKRMSSVAMWGIPFVMAIATIWSFENLAYTVAPTFAWAVFTMQRRSIVSFILRYFLCLLIIGLLYLSPAMLRDQDIDLTLYYRYPLLYARGFGLVSVYERPAAWLLAPALYLLPIVSHLVGKKQDDRILLLSFYGLAILTYFLARATALNFPPVAIPLILLALHFAMHSSWPRLIALPAVATIFLVPALTFEIATGAQLLVSRSDLELINPSSEHFALSRETFERKHCSADLEELRAFSFRHTLPLLSLREDGYLIHSCLRMANTYGLDPYSAATINLGTASAILDQIIQTRSPFLLGQPSAFFLPNYNPDAIFLLREAVRLTGAKEIREFPVKGEMVDVYRVP